MQPRAYLSALAVICIYAGLEIDLKPYEGSYGQGSEEPRDIPSDDLIVQWRDRFPNEQWQWVYGMIAAFGLRPHEVFFCKFIDALTVEVFKGTKTGYHVTRAIQPRWVEDWNLTIENRPSVSGKTMRDYGQFVSTQSVDTNCPLCPTTLPRLCNPGQRRRATPSIRYGSNDGAFPAGASEYLSPLVK